MSELAAEFRKPISARVPRWPHFEQGNRRVLRNALPFSLVAFIAWLPVGLIYYETLDLPAQEREMSESLAGWFDVFSQLIAFSAIAHTTFRDMRGRPVRFWESAMRGLKRFFPMAGAFILYALGVGLGLVLLIVPGLLLLVRWYVFAPVCVVEGKGPLESFKRSAELTEGNRWKLFAFRFVTLILAGMAVTALVKLGLAAALAPAPALFLSGIWQGAWSAFTNVLSVVVYHDLRAAKEGAGIESIASVFD